MSWRCTKFAPQPGFSSSTTSLPSLTTCVSVACLAGAALLGTRKQSVVTRYWQHKDKPYNGQGVFPGGGDGSWREGKKGSFGPDSPKRIMPAPFSSGQTPLERLNSMNYDEKFTTNTGVLGNAGKAASSTPVAALGVAALIVFWAAQASNAMPN